MRNKPNWARGQGLRGRPAVGPVVQTKPMGRGPGGGLAGGDRKQEEIGRGRPNYEETPCGVTTSAPTGPACETKPIWSSRYWVGQETVLLHLRALRGPVVMIRPNKTNSRGSLKLEVSSFKRKEPGGESSESSDFTLPTSNWPQGKPK